MAPNILSFYQIVAFPAILYFPLARWEKTFVTLLIINLITDILDGFIAGDLIWKQNWVSDLTPFRM